MRKILFRAKRLDNGEWVYGYYVHYNDIKDNKDHCDYIVQEHNGEYFPFIQVIPETVGQFTGLTDKNGKKIFEGDIVQYQPEYATEPIHSVVEYCADKFNYPAFDLKNHDYEANGLQCAHEEGVGCEVIGNIHDNSALLGDD